MDRATQLPVILGDRLRGVMYAAGFLIAVGSLWTMALANNLDARGPGDYGKACKVPKITAAHVVPDENPPPAERSAEAVTAADHSSLDD